MHWSFGTATDGELHTLSENEETVNKHINALHDVVQGDHADLVRAVEDMKYFLVNVTQVLEKVKASLHEMEEGINNRIEVP